MLHSERQGVQRSGTEYFTVWLHVAAQLHKVYGSLLNQGRPLKKKSLEDELHRTRARECLFLVDLRKMIIYPPLVVDAGQENKRELFIHCDRVWLQLVTGSYGESVLMLCNNVMLPLCTYEFLVLVTLIFIEHDRLRVHWNVSNGMNGLFAKALQKI